MQKNEKNLHFSNGCSLPEPYPEPKVMKPNQYYAVLLLEDYAGVVSELTAITQFFHHHLVFDGVYEEVAELEKDTAIVEMHHLKLLGETIKLLGVDPKYRTLTDNIASYWKASYVYYGNDICDRLAADIAAERSAISQYRCHQKLINDKYIKELLERLILDEELHLKLFKQMADKYCPGVCK